MLLGYSFEPRTNSCALGTAGSISYDQKFINSRTDARVVCGLQE